MAVESDKSRSCIKPARFDKTHPSIGRQTGDGSVELGPLFTTISCQLQVAIIRSDPDDVFILWTLGHCVDGTVVFCRRIVGGETTGLKLPLLGGVIGGKVRRNSLPAVTHIFRHEQILRSKIHAFGLVRTDVYGRIPVKAVLLLPCLRVRCYGLCLPGRRIVAHQVASLVFAKNDFFVERVPE